jgi:hypothetical protein
LLSNVVLHGLFLFFFHMLTCRILHTLHCS